MLSSHKSFRLTAAALVLTFAGAMLSACSYTEEHSKDVNLSFSNFKEEEKIETQETFAVPSAKADTELTDFIPKLDSSFGENTPVSVSMEITEGYSEKSPADPNNDIYSDELSGIEIKYPFYPVPDPDSSNITQEDINACISLAEKSASDIFAQPIIEADVCDIDFDGEDEMLVFLMAGTKEIHIYEKENGEMVLSSILGSGQLNKVPSLDLHVYTDLFQEYAYFVFHYDNGGVMDCDVLTAIKHKDADYSLEFLLSWGTLDYSETLPDSGLSQEFYRKGWGNGTGYTDIGLDGNYNDISREEFLDIYNRYLDLEPITF